MKIRARGLVVRCGSGKVVVPRGEIWSAEGSRDGGGVAGTSPGEGKVAVRPALLGLRRRDMRANRSRASASGGGEAGSIIEGGGDGTPGENVCVIGDDLEAGSLQ